MIWLAPLLGAAVAAALGARLVAPAARTWRTLLVGGAVYAVLAVLALAGERGHGVSDGDYVKGLALAGLLFGPVPFAAYFGLGRALARWRWVLVVVFVVSLAALFYYAFFALIATLELVHCGPDAYECPI